MIRLPLDLHHRLDVDVELDGDGFVRLALDLLEGELLGGPVKSWPELDHADEGIALNGNDPEDVQRRMAAEHANRRLELELEHRAEEVAYLRARLEQVRTLPDLCRSFRPDEARALAAVLVHFAAEAER